MKLYALVSIFMLTLLSASAFEVTTQSLTYQIFRDESAEFLVNITNPLATSDMFTVFTASPNWKVFGSTERIKVLAKSSVVVPIILDPSNTIEDGKVFGVPITVESLNSRNTVVVQASVQVNSDKFRTYAPNVFVEPIFGTDQQVDPTQAINVQIKVFNKNPLEISPLNIVLESTLFTKTVTTTLGQSESKTLSEIMYVDPTTPPQTVRVHVKSQANGETLPPRSIQMTILEINPDFKREIIEDSESFLKSVKRIKLTNVGNVEATKRILIDSNLLHRFVSSSTLKGTYVEEQGKAYLAYDTTLAPGASVELGVTTNYRATVIITSILLLILISAVVGYYIFRSPIKIERNYMPLGKSENVSRIKVVISVKNRTSKLVENIRVIERTPAITEVDKEFIAGTIQPSKILQNHNKGTLVSWDFATLEPYEERIITYTLNSKLVIIGGTIKLPPTVVKYESYGHTRTVSEKSIIHRSSQDDE